MDNTLIKDENIMIFHPKLAELLGLNESIILNQIHYWINKGYSKLLYEKYKSSRKL